jgi:hypothetical protein
MKTVKSVESNSGSVNCNLDVGWDNLLFVVNVNINLFIAVPASLNLRTHPGQHVHLGNGIDRTKSQNGTVGL